MKIYIVGNPLIEDDSLPLRILPYLRMSFPGIIFEEADPNENFIPEEGSVIMDTVIGIKRPLRFETIDAFVTTRSVNAHDYDLALHLQLLQKIHKLKKIRIFGIPSSCAPEAVVNFLTSSLHNKR